MQEVTLFKNDSLDVLDAIPENSVDVIFADPPYNMQLGEQLTRPDGSTYDGVVEQWDKYESFASYDEFTVQWLRKARRLIKPGGTIWVMGSYHNIFRIGKAMQDIGYWILNHVNWIKTNPTPNFRGTRLTNAHEDLIWAQKSRDKKDNFRFVNYKLVKVLNGGKQLRSDWYLPICAGKERLRDENGNSIHSTQKPISLLIRALVVSSKPGDVVLDPFFGTGTTGVAARLLNRKIIGIEKEQIYFELASRRLEEVEPIIHSDDEIWAYLNGDLSNPRIAMIVNAFARNGKNHD